MRPPLHNLSAAGLGLTILALTGCSPSAIGDLVASPSDGSLAPPSSPAVQQAPTTPPENAASDSPPGVPGKNQSAAVDEEPQDMPPEYQWPNPGREDIFLPPAEIPVNTTTVDRRNDHGVALIGFADVDRQQVLLKVDGIVAPLAVGDSRGELQVVSIDPPEVTLKRGDRQWTEKLFDTP